jgi:SAM-dependent methyltransferase
MEYVKRFVPRVPVSVLEIGSRDINGTVRQLFPQDDYTGCDIVSGPCVDVVCDAASCDFGRAFDIVVSTEVLEHTASWQQIVENAIKHLAPNGRLILTCAGPGRPVHSAEGRGTLKDDEWYCNITPACLYDVLCECGIDVDSLELFHTDTRASGVKP